MVHFLAQAAKRRPTRSFTSYLSHLGAAGLFFLAILDSSPIPTFGGPDILTAILSASHHDLWIEYAATATLGSVIGAYFTFRLARKAGSAFLDRKFKKGKLRSFLNLFDKWGTGTLAASTAIPLPTPTSMLFAAAGVSDYPPGKFVAVVAVSRTVRYFGIAFLAAQYGRQFLRVLRHPTQHWGWLLLFISLMLAMAIGAILLNRRFATTPAN